MVPLFTLLVPIVAGPNFGFRTGHPRLVEGMGFQIRLTAER